MLEGAYAGIDNGYYQSEIADAAYAFERKLNNGSRVMVGVNGFTEGNEDSQPDLEITLEQEMDQIKRLQAVRADCDDEAVRVALATLRRGDRPGAELMPALVDTVRTYATEGEIMDVGGRVRALRGAAGHRAAVAAPAPSAGASGAPRRPGADVTRATTTTGQVSTPVEISSAALIGPNRSPSMASSRTASRQTGSNGSKYHMARPANAG